MSKKGPPDKSWDPASLSLDLETRQTLWRELASAMEDYFRSVESLSVASNATPKEVRTFLKSFDFAKPMEPSAALASAVRGLTQFQTHVPHPRYFGLFNPAPSTMGIAADALVAAFNPQLAVWKHSPFAVEVERHLFQAFGAQFGYAPAQTDGVFASGGSEANHTALLAALTHSFPDFAIDGLRKLPSQPVFYVSAESHHSFHKAARLCGLGSSALREIPADENLRMSVDALQEAIRGDRQAGLAPFLLVATAGTTNAGAIDPIRHLGAVAERERLWFHVDAAWGGAAVLVPELRPHLDGMELADSITLDAHKWLSVPMGAGMYLTRHPDILGRTFQISAAYVPPKAEGEGVIDSYEHSLHWSRRFIGLKLFLSLCVAGWEGYAAVLRRMTAMGEELRRQLRAAGWEVLNSTPLPIVCFADRRPREGESSVFLESIARHVVGSGCAWISTTRLSGSFPALRACITNFRTAPADVAILVEALDAARRAHNRESDGEISLPA